MNTRILIRIAALCALLAGPSSGNAQGTAFTYQGRLNDGANLANGNYDLTFALFSASSGAGQVGSTQTNSAVAVSNGLFVATLDFGTGVFTGADRWLEIGVRTNGAVAFTNLALRQKISVTPYAITAGNLSGTLSAAQLSGTVPLARLSGITSNQLDATTWQLATNVNGGNAAALNGLAATSLWQLGGNDVAPGQFLGSTNNQPVEFRVNGARILRLEPDVTGQGAPNIVGGSPSNFVANGVVGATISGGGATNTFRGVGPGGTTNTFGFSNSVTANFGTIGGGQLNTVSGHRATVSGGGRNTASARDATVGGGLANTAGAQIATVSGGEQNTASGDDSTVGGGFSNSASGTGATVAGGAANRATGNRATVPGGALNLAAGEYSFAGGFRAKANNDGAFVWADSQQRDFTSTSNNQFLIRAQNGVGINTNNPATALHVNGTVTATSFNGVRLDDTSIWFRSGDDVNHGLAYYGFGKPFGTLQPDGPVLFGFGGGALGSVNGGPHAVLSWDANNVSLPNTASLLLGNQTRQMITLYTGPSDTYGLGVQNNTEYFRTGAPSGFAWFKGGVHSNNQNDPGAGGTVLMTLDNGGNLRTVSGTIATLSDREAKTEFTAVDGKEILERVVNMPVRRWAYKTAPAGQRHIGPMAQDFYAAFNVGLDDKSICTVDADGVALAAIQGLNQKIEQRDGTWRAELREKDARIAALEKDLAGLRELVGKLATQGKTE